LRLPHDHSDENGLASHNIYRHYGDTIQFIHLVQWQATGHNYNGVFMPEFIAQEVDGDRQAIMMVDHIVGKVNRQNVVLG